MKQTLLAVLAASTFLSTASFVSAAEIEALSKIDAVTVYPRGAEVTRVTTVDISAGDHTLVLDNLPGEIDTQSIRVEGSAGAPIEIGSVDSRVVHVTGEAETAPQRARIEDQIEILQDERAALSRQNENIKYQRELIQDLARRPFVTGQSSDKDLRVDSAELGNLFDMVAGRLQALDGQALDIRIKLRKVDEDIRDLQTELGALAPKQQTKAIVTVHLSSEAETSGTFSIRYRVHNAGWRPFYDARLTMADAAAKPALSLVRRAEIVQNTTENWNDVALTLSTARPVGATAAPELLSQALILTRPGNGGILGMYSAGDEAAEPKRRDLADRAMKAERLAAPALEADAVRLREAEVTLAGFQALYGISGRVSVDNSGSAKKVRIAANDIDASLGAHAVPALDPNAYLTASFTFDGETPLLPGRVLLYRDNVFMGQGALPMLTPGQDHALGFGVDDNIKIKRTEVRSETSESGIISTDLVRENTWLIEVQNLHVRTMPVKIYDRMPYSTHEDIKVSLLRGTTQPSDRNVDNKRGVLAWDYELAKGEEQTIRFGYRVSSPKDMPIQVGMR